jgi:hypothetical protein
VPPTHWSSLGPAGLWTRRIAVDGSQRVIEDVVVTSAGVSAGIDMAFEVVKAICGRRFANETARYIEYPSGWIRRLSGGDGGLSFVYIGKGIASLVVYATAIPLAFVNRGSRFRLYVAVALIWFVPDRRIERALADQS